MESNSKENPVQRIIDAFDEAAAKGHEEKKEFIRGFSNECKATRESLKREREMNKLAAKVMKENRRRFSTYLIEKCEELK